MQLVEEIVVVGRQLSGTGMVNSLLEILLGGLVECPPVGTATVSGTIVLATNILEGQGIAIAVYVLHVTAASLVATSLKSHTANQSVYVCL